MLKGRPALRWALQEPVLCRLRVTVLVGPSISTADKARQRWL